MDYEDIVNMKKALAKRIRDMKSEDGALDMKTLEELKLKLTGSISWTRWFIYSDDIRSLQFQKVY